MKIVFECKEDIYSHSGTLLFGKGARYKGESLMEKTKLYLIKDSTGSFQNLYAGAFFDRYFKITEEQGEAD